LYTHTRTDVLIFLNKAYTSRQLAESIWSDFIGKFEDEFTASDVKNAVDPFTRCTMSRSIIANIKKEIQAIIFGTAHTNINLIDSLGERISGQGFILKKLIVNNAQMKKLAVEQLRNLHRRKMKYATYKYAFDEKSEHVQAELATITNVKTLVGWEIFHRNFIRMRRGSGWDLLFLDASQNSGCLGGTNYSIQAQDANRQMVPLAVGTYIAF